MAKMKNANVPLINVISFKWRKPREGSKFHSGYVQGHKEVLQLHQEDKHYVIDIVPKGISPVANFMYTSLKIPVEHVTLEKAKLVAEATYFALTSR